MHGVSQKVCAVRSQPQLAKSPWRLSGWQERRNTIFTWIQISGAGRSTLPPFLEDLHNNCARRVYSTSHFADIQKTPAPLWELADLRQYASMSIQYTRGCPYHCEFCNVTSLFGRNPRTKTPEQIVADLDSFYSTGWRGSVFFVDDNLIGNKKSLKNELLPALIKWQREHVPIPFNTEVSINVADDESLIRMMSEAGFNSVFVGIETPDTDSL